MARAYAAGASHALSVAQCVGDHVWQGSRLYAEGGYRRLGLRREVAVDIPDLEVGGLAVFSIARGGSDFTERERDTLNLLRPHIARAWTQVGRRGDKMSPALIRLRFPALSQREAEVLFWIIEGKLNTEIADILRRRLNTVQEHVENLLRKLDMENRHQMTVHVLRACLGR